jgi:hypothetical protein
MFKNLINIFNDNKLVVFLLLGIISSYNSPFLFLLDYNQLNVFKIFVIYQYISPLIIFTFLIFYVSKYNFFFKFFSNKNLTLKLFLVLNFTLIFGIFFNNLVYFYPVDEVSSQISGKVFLDWKSSYTRLIFVINNLNIIFLSFVCFKEERLKFILSFIIAVLFIISFYYIFKILYDYINIDRVIYFYESEKLRLGSSTFNYVNPRSSGLARIILLISIFFIIFFLFYDFKSNFYCKFLKYFIFLLIIFYNFFIIQLQSRVSMYFLYLFLFLFIFFNIFIKIYKIKKIIFIIFSFFILPFFISIIFTEYKKNKIIDYIVKDALSKGLVIEKSTININELGLGSSNRIFDTTTSGRKNMWLKVINSYENIPLLGYGVLGDRFAYSFSVSNIFLYFLISGGLAGFLIIIFFNILLSKNILNSLSSMRLFNNREPFFYISFVFILFFLFRSLVENSYGQFSIDLMLLVPSCLIFEKYLRKHKVIT